MHEQLRFRHEKDLLPEIEKAIQNANLGFNPMNNGEQLIISVPPLTEESAFSFETS